MTAHATETIRCPFCGDDGQEVLHQDGWTGRQCASCRLVFVSPRPSAEATREIYTADESNERARGHVASFSSPTARLDARRVVRLLDSLMPPGRLLEIGPGGGAVLHAARRNGWTVGAVELNPGQAAFIRDTLGTACWGSLEEVEGTWDVVYHRDVLSHLPDPVQEFKAMRELLRENGLHVFETGNGDFARRFDTLFASFQFPDHLFFFSPKALGLLLDRSGFDLVKINAFSLVPLLRLENVVRRVRGRGGVVGSERVSETQFEISEPGRAGSWARTALAVARFAAVHGIGRVAPKRLRPQHLIVVARRR
jgi:SAM-dependent methyltransferase